MHGFDESYVKRKHWHKNELLKENSLQLADVN